jgi:hypothetical protein
MPQRECNKIITRTNNEELELQCVITNEPPSVSLSFRVYVSHKDHLYRCDGLQSASFPTSYSISVFVNVQHIPVRANSNCDNAK